MSNITFAQVAAINAFVEAGKSPWLTIADDTVSGVFVNRDGARAAKSGKPVKYVEGDGYTVTDIDAQLSTLPTADAIADAREFATEKADLPADLEPSVKPVPPVAAEAPKAADKPKADIRHQSEVVRPTKLVWAIADRMVEANPAVTRKEVLAECDRIGIAYYTARTQYQFWKSVLAPTSTKTVDGEAKAEAETEAADESAE